MRILHITASYKPAYVYGGPVFSISTLAESYVQYSVHTEVYTTTANGSGNLDVPTGRPTLVEKVPVRYFRRFMGGLFVAPALVRAVWADCKSFDVVHIHSWWNTVSVFTTIVCLLRGVTPLISLRGTMSGFAFAHNKTLVKRVFHKYIGRNLLKKSIIHFTSKGEYENAKSWIDVRNYFILKNIIRPPERLKQSHSERKILSLVYIGRIHPIKNLEVLINAMQDITAPCELKIYGKGDPEYVKSLQSRTSDNVYWMGWIEGNAKYQALRDADVVVLISQYENFGNIIVEALSQGTPVMCARGIGITDFIEENDLGWIVTPEMDSIRDVIVRMHHELRKRERIRQTGAQIVSETFGAQTMVKMYLEAYQKFLMPEYSTKFSEQRI